MLLRHMKNKIPAVEIHVLFSNLFANIMSPFVKVFLIKLMLFLLNSNSLISQIILTDTSWSYSSQIIIILTQDLGLWDPVCHAHLNPRIHRQYLISFSNVESEWKVSVRRYYEPLTVWISRFSKCRCFRVLAFSILWNNDLKLQIFVYPS